MQRRTALGGPARPANNSDRLFRLRQQSPHPQQSIRIGKCWADRGTGQVGDLNLVLLHFLRQGDDDRTGPATGGDIDRVGDDLWDAPGMIDLGDPFCQGREHLPVIDFLEGIAAGVLVRDLADEQQHRRAVLERDVHPDRAMACARPAGHHGRGRASGELAVGVGHIDRPSLEPARHQLDLAALVIKAIKRVQEAFTRNLEHMVNALRDERVGQYASAMAGRGAGLAGLGQFHRFFSLRLRRIRTGRGGGTVGQRSRHVTPQGRFIIIRSRRRGAPATNLPRTSPNFALSSG